VQIICVSQRYLQINSLIPASSLVAQMEERHHIGEPGFVQPGRSMVHIGG
jgi:hypothetical protein